MTNKTAEERADIERVWQEFWVFAGGVDGVKV